MNAPGAAPIILTLAIDQAAHTWFDRLRSRYFPADRLLVGAHITLFHALPGAAEPHIRATVAALASSTAPFPIAVAGTRFLGRGVAFALAAPGADALRATLAAAFASHLTAQDQAPWRAHITIQNKVTPAQARETEAALRALTPPGDVTAIGVSLWHYMGGPWEAAGTCLFGESLAVPAKEGVLF